MMYSPRSDEWERLPWLPDAPGKIVPRHEPLFPVSWLATLMVAVAVASFWAGSTSIRAEQRVEQTGLQSPEQAARAMSADATAIMAVELLDARAVRQRAPRANAPY